MGLASSVVLQPLEKHVVLASQRGIDDDRSLSSGGGCYDGGRGSCKRPELGPTTQRDPNYGFAFERKALLVSLRGCLLLIGRLIQV